MEKLIRQKIQLDNVARTRQASRDELPRLLGRKLVEESEELLQALMLAPDVIERSERRRQITDEAADVLEVVYTILDKNGITTSSLAMRMEAKRNARGGFEDRVLTNAPDDRAETKLRALVEDCMRVLYAVHSGTYPEAGHGREFIDKLHQRAQDLGCLGEVA